MPTPVSQRLLAELFHEDNVDGVLYHQDAVMMKGCSSDDSRNFTGSLLLIQKRPVGAKRFLKGVALPQPHYLVWLPYSYLYCLASHLLSLNARKAIDTETDLVELTAFTAKLKNAMMDLENPTLVAAELGGGNYYSGGSGGGSGADGSGSPTLLAKGSSPFSSPTSPSSSTVVEKSPQRLDWQYTICVPIGMIHKMIRKSNIRGRRVLTIVRRETMAVEAPLIFEEGGMSKLFDELKKICQVEIRAGDEAYLSREQITSSTPFVGYHNDDDEVASSAGGRSSAVDGGISSSSTRGSSVVGPNHHQHSHYRRADSTGSTASGFNNATSGGGGDGLFYDMLSDKESVNNGGGLLSGGFKSKATVEKEKGDGKEKEKGGLFSAVLSIGATFARGTAKAASALIPEDPPSETDVYSRIEYSNNNNNNNNNYSTSSRSNNNNSNYNASTGGGTNSGNQGGNEGGYPSSSRASTNNTNPRLSSGRADTESDFDFADDVSSTAFESNNNADVPGGGASPPPAGAGGRGRTTSAGAATTTTTSASSPDHTADHEHGFMHADGTIRKHHEPSAPVLRMPLSNRKLAPPLSRIDWKGAFENNVNSVRLTSNTNNSSAASSSATASVSAGNFSPSSSSNAPSFPSILPRGGSESGGGGGGSTAAQKVENGAADGTSAAADTSNKNVIGREFAYGGTGNLKDTETFKRLRIKAYNGTISDDIRPQVWAYLLGVFPIGSSPAERRAILDAHEAEYRILSSQWRSIFPSQEARFGAYREHKIAVEKDVMRTDRTHPEFKADDSAKLAQLRHILMAYAMYNFDLGYCQGMSDILAIILLVYPNDEVMGYTVFKHLLANKIEGNFRTEMKQNIEVHLREVQLLTSKFSPDLYKHLVAVGAEGMTFTFRWLLILFKREFDIKSVIKLWDVIFASPFTPHYEAIVAAAILQNVGDQIISQNLAYDEILKFANLMTNRFDVNDVIMLSHDFYNMVTQQLGLTIQRESAAAAGSSSSPASSGGGGGSGGGNGSSAGKNANADTFFDDEVGVGGGEFTGRASQSLSSNASAAVNNNSIAFGNLANGGGGRSRTSSAISVHASMLGGGGGMGAAGIVGSDQTGPSSAAASSAVPSSINSTTVSISVARPTLHDIIAFLEKEQKAASLSPSHRDPYSNRGGRF